ncbi:MAG: hypothetical protein INQ03_24350 [Candidatus Heimdallarchaeota archaeon]|nr:hypothetical protein [Candidatus Heimdallarchaeota archaeon]
MRFFFLSLLIVTLLVPTQASIDDVTTRITDVSPFIPQFTHENDVYLEIDVELVNDGESIGIWGDGCHRGSVKAVNMNFSSPVLFATMEISCPSITLHSVSPGSYNYTWGYYLREENNSRIPDGSFDIYYRVMTQIGPEEGGESKECTNAYFAHIVVTNGTFEVRYSDSYLTNLSTTSADYPIFTLVLLPIIGLLSRRYHNRNQ